MTGNNMAEKNMFSVLHACFEGLRGLPSFFRILLSYFIAQITISGLSLFVVPFFSSRILSQNAVTGRFIASALFWFLFAAASVLSDYYGNRHNLRAYYEITQEQFKYHFLRVLGQKFAALKKFPVETLVSRLQDETEMMANIVLWAVGFLAMLASCLVVFVWSMALYPLVLGILFVQSLISIVLRHMFDTKMERIIALRTEEEQRLDDIHYAMVHEQGFLLDKRFAGLLSKKWEHAHHAIARFAQREAFFSWAGSASVHMLDNMTKALCLYLLQRLSYVDNAVIIPIFTLHSTYMNQMLSMQANLSSIRQNKSALARIRELEAVEESGEPLYESGAELVCRVKNLTALSDEGEKILDNISFSIKKGEKVALIGENGSGKTTLARAILGLYPIGGGSVVLRGKPAYSPVSPQLFDASLLENLDYVQRMAEDPPLPAAAEKIQSLCGGQSGEIFAAEDVNKLSGGQQRLAAHARAMLYERELLILDEPSASLNEKTAAEVMNFVFGLPSALLFITHDMALAKRADRILRMERGKFKNIG